MKPGNSRYTPTDGLSFSILERIDVGETSHFTPGMRLIPSFSILERIDVGETVCQLSSSSPSSCFQYPRTDRRG